ncbi:hypothetical protein [Turkeypox virus]|uniref:Uncharacterized protein n=1 Tax=Turkeypox virus TaxID=336486 RepID=A0A0M3PBA8_9POXV|nr:hypothetical protein ASN15_gp116 [Turkeypox virus]ALA62490.1 hypothetical protein [Turkeypox virus]
MKDIRTSVITTPVKDSQAQLATTEKEIRSYDEIIISNDTTISKIKTCIDERSDGYCKDSIKYIINNIMEDDTHCLHDDIDNLLVWRNDILALVTKLEIDDQLRTLLQTLVRELTFKKIKCTMYSHAMVCLCNENTVLTSKIQEYFIQSILADSTVKKLKRSPVTDLKILENIINKNEK